jgi:hypothetical protein
MELVIETVDDKGNMSGSLGPNTVTGTYDDATQSLSLDDALVPGEIILSTFYDGRPIPNTGAVSAFAGSFHELTLQVHPRPIPHMVRGAWYAVWQSPIIF